MDSSLDQVTGLIRQILYVTTRYTWKVHWIKELDSSDNYSTLQPGIHGKFPGSSNWTYQTTTLRYNQVYLDSPLDQGAGLIPGFLCFNEFARKWHSRSFSSKVYLMSDRKSKIVIKSKSLLYTAFCLFNKQRHLSENKRELENYFKLWQGFRFLI